MTTLVLLGPAREAAGVRRDEFDATTVGELIAQALERYGEHFARVLASSQIWLNGEEALNDTALGPYDEVAVLPPISGG